LRSKQGMSASAAMLEDPPRTAASVVAIDAPRPKGPDGESRAWVLALADRYYASGDRGLPLLPWRCALAVRTARRVYSGIGLELARVGHDVRAGRAVVPFSRKLRLLVDSTLRAVLELPTRLIRRALSWRAGVIDGPELGRL